MTAEEFLNAHPLPEVLRALQLRNLSESADYYRFSSPFREDRDPSMVCYKHNSWCIDFGGSFRGSVFALTRQLTGQSLFKLFNEEFTPRATEWVHPSRDRSARRVFPEERRAPAPVVMTGKLSHAFPEDGEIAEECARRFITPSFWQEFHLMSCTAGEINGMPIYNRLLIPIMENGIMISVEARDVTRRSAKKVLYPPRGTVNTLFQLDTLDRREPLIVVEGIMDLPKIWTHVTSNCTTTFGIQLTRRQRELLNEFEQVVLFPDGDDGGHRFIENMDEALDREFQVAWIEGKDPGEATVSEIQTALQSAVPFTQRMIEEIELFPEEKITWD